VDRSPNAPSDEVSLRELYLILRRGAAGIAVFAVVVGVAAFLLVSSRPVRYGASASVQLVPPLLSSQTPYADQVPQVSLNAQAYAMVARSTDVVAATLDVAPDANDPTLRSFRERSEVRATDASGQARPTVNAEHRVVAPLATLAAEQANDWAEATVAAATAALRAPYEAAYTSASDELAARDAELAAAEAAWATFAADDSRAQVTLRLDGLAALEAQNDVQRVALERLITSNTAQRDLLLAVVDARESGDPAGLAAQLEALLAAGVLDEGTDAALRRALATRPAGDGESLTADDAVTLVARARLEALTAELAGYVAERNRLAEGDGQMAAEAASLRADLADLERRAAALQRALASAQAAHARLSSVVPLLASQLGLAESAARVVVRATPATDPEPRNRLVVTLAATLVAAMVATLFVFLREAVREPAAVRPVAMPDALAADAPRMQAGSRRPPPTGSSAGPSGPEGG